MIAPVVPAVPSTPVVAAREKKSPIESLLGDGLKMIFNQQQQSPVVVQDNDLAPIKKLRKASESEVETKILAVLQEKPIEMILLEAQIRVNPLIIDRFEDIGIATIVNIYCTPKKDFDTEYVKGQLFLLFNDILIVHKLYSYLQHLKDSFI